MTEKESSGCLKYTGIGCLGIIILCVVGVIVTQIYGEKFARIGISKLVEAGATAVVADSSLPKEEQDELLALAKEFVADIREDRISLEQMGKVAEEVFSPEVMVAVFTPVFKSKFIEKSGLSEEEKATGVIDMERFAMGLSEGAIPKENGETFLGMVTVKNNKGPGPNKNRVLKETLTDSELRACLKLMSDSANEANVTHKPFTLKPVEVIRKAIEMGKTK